jgi:hypothetical protein
MQFLLRFFFFTSRFRVRTHKSIESGSKSGATTLVINRLLIPILERSSPRDKEKLAVWLMLFIYFIANAPLVLEIFLLSPFRS